MKEAQQLSKAFSDLTWGNHRMGLSILATLTGLSAKKAATRPFPGCNSIWELTEHMIGWRSATLQILQGISVPPDEENYFVRIDNRNEKAWQQCCQRFEQSGKEWMAFLATVSRRYLSAQSLEPPFTNYDLILAVLAHDAYHLGQIQLVQRLLQFKE